MSVVEKYYTDGWITGWQEGLEISLKKAIQEGRAADANRINELLECNL